MLRRVAIWLVKRTWLMERASADQPNGSIMRPPEWYQRDPQHHPRRPFAWIKDRRAGKIRPWRRKNEQRDNLAPEERESWLQTYQW